MKIERTSGKPWRQVGPYSRRLQRGAIADAYDGRSTEGRFVRSLEAQLFAHVGGNPSVTERLLIQRIIRLRMRLDLFEEKLDKEPSKWTAHDDRVYGGIQSAFRLALRELGFKAPPQPQRTFHDMLAELNASKAPK